MLQKLNAGDWDLLRLQHQGFQQFGVILCRCPCTGWSSLAAAGSQGDAPIPPWPRSVITRFSWCSARLCPFLLGGVCSCFDLACWGKSSLISFQSVVEPVLTAVCTHTSNLVSFLAFLTDSNRDAALGKKRFLLVEAASIQIYPQLPYEGSFLVHVSGFSLHLFSPLEAQVPLASRSLPGMLRKAAGASPWSSTAGRTELSEIQREPGTPRKMLALFITSN